MAQIGQRRAAHLQEEVESEQTRLKAQVKVFENKLPTDPLKEELRRRKVEDPLSMITEWEKGRLKRLFKVYDRDKKGCIK